MTRPGGNDGEFNLLRPGRNPCRTGMTGVSAGMTESPTCCGPRAQSMPQNQSDSGRWRGLHPACGGGIVYLRRTPVGTRGFDRGGHCGTAGRGCRQSPKQRRQTNNWQARASPSRVSAATFIGSRSSTGPNERRLSRCCPTDADRKGERFIGWPRRRTMPVRTVGGEKQIPAMPVEVLVQGLFWTGSSTLPRLHQPRL